MSATPSAPTSPLRRAEPKDPPASAMTLTERPRCTPLVVVVFRAKRTSTWLLSSTSTMQPSAPSVSADGQAALHELLGRESPTVTGPTPRAC